jgi:hypothetical protein
MKKTLPFSILALCLALTACGTPTTPAAVYAPMADLQATQVPFVTPGVPKLMFGDDLQAGEANANWPQYTNQAVGYTLNLPPDWTVATDPNDGVHLLPPGSSIDQPSEQIQINYYNVPYQPGVSVFGLPVEKFFPMPRADSQFYLPNGLMLPIQSAFVEQAYRGGVLAFQISLGPSQNLLPAFNEINSTLQLMY